MGGVLADVGVLAAEAAPGELDTLFGAVLVRLVPVEQPAVPAAVRISERLPVGGKRLACDAMMGSLVDEELVRGRVDVYERPSVRHDCPLFDQLRHLRHIRIREQRLDRTAPLDETLLDILLSHRARVLPPQDVLAEFGVEDHDGLATGCLGTDAGNPSV